MLTIDDSYTNVMIHGPGGYNTILEVSNVSSSDTGSYELVLSSASNEVTAHAYSNVTTVKVLGKKLLYF